jgi:UDP:flavonoid glycosyltransferase YjiC (YdhE family)
VSHGGAGTILAGLAHGIPQLCLPQGADHFLNGAALMASGAGLTLGPDGIDEESIRASIARLLTDGSIATRARVVANQIAAMPTSDQVAAAIVQDVH